MGQGGYLPGLLPIRDRGWQEQALGTGCHGTGSISNSQDIERGRY